MSHQELICRSCYTEVSLTEIERRADTDGSDATGANEDGESRGMTCPNCDSRAFGI